MVSPFSQFIRALDDVLEGVENFAYEHIIENNFLKVIFSRLFEVFNNSLRAADFSKKSIEVRQDSENAVTHLMHRTVGRGITNSGNSCYMAAALQGLLRVPQMAQKIWEANAGDENSESASNFLKQSMSPLFGINEPGRSLNVSETEAIRTFFRKQGWMPEMAHNLLQDPADFLRFLLPLLELPEFAASTRDNRGGNNKGHLLSIPARNLQQPISLQDFVAPKDMASADGKRKGYKLFPEVIPDILPIVIAGRTMVGNSKNRTDIFPSQQLEVPLQGDTKKCIKYDLIAVLVHMGENPTGGHYLTYVPQDDGWVEYNDQYVAIRRNDQTVDQRIQEDSYIYFYSRSQ